ncbi:hypothetical protein ACWCQP_46810 [Streptomyces chartreusis]
MPSISSGVDGLGAAVCSVQAWVSAYAWWLLAGAVLGGGGWAYGWVWWLGRARRVLSQRVVVDLVPSQGFDPSVEVIERHAARLARVPAAAGWVPARASGVRVRHLCVDGKLASRLEGPAHASGLLRLPVLPDVDVLDSGAGGLSGVRIRFEGVAPLKRKHLGREESAAESGDGLEAAR